MSNPKNNTFVSKNLLFTKFCDLCNKIASAPKPSKLEIVAKFVANWRTTSTNTAEDNFFSAMRLLVPQLDRDRGAYGIKENTLAKIYIRILCLPPDGSDALKLINYRAPKNAGSQAGDFAEVAYWILKRRSGTGGELTLFDVNVALDSIVKKHEEHDPRGVDMELTHLLQATSAEEQKWLIRIILKDMKLGIGYNSVLDVFHPEAKDLYDVTNSLAKVCETLHDPCTKLNEIEIKLFSPFLPMLSEELNIQLLDPHFNRVPYFFVETKLDGERFQLHMDNGNYKYFSRRAHDYTSNFGANSSEGMLTPFLSLCISPNVTSVILDGEMMCWNKKTEKFTTKAMNIDVKKLNESHDHRPCFCSFDILFLNGEVLTNKPLYHRLELLEKSLFPKKGVLYFCPRDRISKKEEVWDALNNAIDNSEEGIILKEFDVVYKPKVRKKGGWFKIKPEYTDSLMDTLDLLIIGGYYGEGRFGGGVSNFLLGVSTEGKFWSVARVSTGLTMSELNEVQRKLEPHWHKSQPGSMPENIEWTKEKPDVWIEPSKSVVLEIKATEIVKSDLYRTGYTLRFGRIKNIRYDKLWSDSLTLAEFHEKRTNASGKLTAHKLTDEDLLPSPSKIKKTRPTAEVAAHFRNADTSSVQVVSQLLAGKEICVMDSLEAMKKDDIEKRIVKFGGKVVQNPGAGTWCVLAESETVRVKSIMSVRLHNVIKCSWLVPLLSRKELTLPDVPRHAYLSLKLETAAKLMTHYDNFGDHYTVPATLESLKLAMAAAKKVLTEVPCPEGKAELDEEIFGGVNAYRSFRLLVAYTPEPLTNTALNLSMLEFVFYGGQHRETLDETVTHVICSEQRSVPRMMEIRRDRVRKFHIVTSEWIHSSVAAKRPLDERLFSFGGQ